MKNMKKRTLKNKQKKTRPAKKKQAPTPYISEIEAESQRFLAVMKNTKEELDAYYPRMIEEPNPEESKSRERSLRRARANTAKALAQIYSVHDELQARMKDSQKYKKKRKISFHAPANAAIDLSESRTNHFAKGINLYKLLLICFVGSFAGVVIEMLWCLFRNGYLQSRAGLIYGPFNLLYGVGAVALTLCLYQFRNRSAWLSFAGGFLVGSVVEYICSWAQEMVFGSRSWDYSHMPFNINGRICLLYSIFWGILGVFWIKSIYPTMAKQILKLPNRAGKIITWVLLAFFLFNGLTTSVALDRWEKRIDGIAPANAFEEFIDDRFPDERMRRVFANMHFPEDNS